MTQILDVLDENDAQLEKEFLEAKAQNALARKQALDGIAQQTRYSKQTQARLQREADQATASAGYTEYAEGLQGRLDELTATISGERDKIQAALDLAIGAATWQHNQPARMAAIIKEFASGAAQFRPMSSSDQEFTKTLLDTVTTATAGKETSWRLKVETNLAKCMRLFGVGWVVPMFGDQRARAISDGIRSARRDQPADLGGE